MFVYFLHMHSIVMFVLICYSSGRPWNKVNSYGRYKQKHEGICLSETKSLLRHKYLLNSHKLGGHKYIQFKKKNCLGL